MLPRKIKQDRLSFILITRAFAQINQERRRAMISHDFRSFACFVVAVSVGTGGLVENPTPVTSAIFLMLCTGSVATLLIAYFSETCDRRQTALRAVDKLTFVWSISGIFFFSNPDSVVLATSYITAFIVVPLMFRLLQKK